MKINSNCNFNYKVQNSGLSQQSFRGYDARQLKAVVMTVCDDPNAFDVVKQVSQIGKKDGFEVYFAHSSNKIYRSLNAIKKFFTEKYGGYCKWAQDVFCVTPNDTVVSSHFPADEELAVLTSKFLNKKYQKLNDIVEGGNKFFVKNGDKQELLLGSNEKSLGDVDFLKKMYGVSDVHFIPQADYHLDLFIRPLKNKQVLVADDKLMIKELKNALSNIEKCKKSLSDTKEIQKLEETKKEIEKVLKDFKNEVKISQNPTADEVSESLQKAGYEPIRVPGRLYYVIPNKGADDLVSQLNYLNAVVHEKSDGTLTFITNKSALNEKCNITPEISEKIGFDFEKVFVKYLKPYVKADDVHFISGKENYIAKVLENQSGGIHCLCTEIPQ